MVKQTGYVRQYPTDNRREVLRFPQAFKFTWSRTQKINITTRLYTSVIYFM